MGRRRGPVACACVYCTAPVYSVWRRTPAAGVAAGSWRTGQDWSLDWQTSRLGAAWQSVLCFLLCCAVLFLPGPGFSRGGNGDGGAPAGGKWKGSFMQSPPALAAALRDARREPLCSLHPRNTFGPSLLSLPFSYEDLLWPRRNEGVWACLVRE